jgi:FKBP-type peptidyl-prolyl cis-trans isomerase FklB
MKAYLTTALALGLAGFASAADAPDLKDPKAKTSYAIGVDIGNNFKKNEIEIEPKALAAGFLDALAGKPALTEDEVKATLEALRQQMMSKMMAKQAETGTNNQKEGVDFLAANAKKEGVKTTASGLQYKVIKSGTGKQPKATDTVKTHYHGTLINGEVFDSSVQRGEPVEFPVNGVIPGWQEALQLMKVGDKWQLFVPSALAYGERGAGGKIGPNAALIFEVELLEVK